MQTELRPVLRMFRAIETGDVKDVVSYIAPDYLNRESIDDSRSVTRGPEEFVETVNWLRAAFSDLSFEYVEMFRCDDRVVVVTQMRGKQVGPFFGIPATERSFSQRQIHLFRVNADDKVSEHLAQRDDLGLRRQLVS